MSKTPEYIAGKAVPKQTREKLEKIVSIPCLYRHTFNRNYYGIKKHGGKIVKRAFKTESGEPITSLQEAKVALAVWLASLGKGGKPLTLEERLQGGGQFTVAMMKDLIHSSGSEEEAKEYVLKNHFGLTTKEARAQGIDLSPLETNEEQIRIEKEAAANNKTPTLAACFAEFNVMKAGNKAGTLEKYKYMKRVFELYNGNDLLAKPVAAITTSELIAFYVGFPNERKPQYFNTLASVVYQVFEMARINKYIKINPIDMMPKNIRRRKVNKQRDVVPTIEQCEAIATSIRNNPSASSREESADICEFMHKGALGQAELRFLTWGDLDFENEIIRCKRIKTETPFDVPMYPFLKPFLVELAAKKPNRKLEDKLFKIQDIKHSLEAACKRLGLPAYSPRDLRKARVSWLVRKGYPAELIAAAQGHADTSLIHKTYANVINEATVGYRKDQLKKLK